MTTDRTQPPATREQLLARVDAQLNDTARHHATAAVNSAVEDACRAFQNALAPLLGTTADALIRKAIGLDAAQVIADGAQDLLYRAYIERTLGLLTPSPITIAVIGPGCPRGMAAETAKTGAATAATH